MTECDIMIFVGHTCTCLFFCYFLFIFYSVEGLANRIKGHIKWIFVGSVCPVHLLKKCTLLLLYDQLYESPRKIIFQRWAWAWAYLPDHQNWPSSLDRYSLPTQKESPATWTGITVIRLLVDNFLPAMLVVLVSN